MNRVGLAVVIASAMVLAARASTPAQTGGATAAQPLAAQHDEGPKIGSPAPAIEGTDPDGKPIKLADFKGKIVLVDFFGDW